MKKELIKNKIFGIGAIGIGIFITIFSKDATILVLALIVGSSLILARENYID